MKTESHLSQRILTPLGELLVKVNNDGVEWLKFFAPHQEGDDHSKGQIQACSKSQRQELRAVSSQHQSVHPLILDVGRQLAAYFSGEGCSFDLPLSLQGTEFQIRVWAELLKIPHGHTQTYSELARAIGAPGAARAVGGACARNPVWIISPCHRVVPSLGGVGGFAAGDSVKRWLLQHEGIDFRELRV